MNGIQLSKNAPILHINEKNRQRVFTPLPVSSLKAYNTGAISKFFDIFHCRIN